MTHSFIQVRGANQNNLKNLDLDIPLYRITIVTGVSGSGKSSLAFDTLYAEGQRRYIETFSPYARQFMDRMDRPRVTSIQGIPPTIAIDRKAPVRTSRSTVGTMTQITDYIKLLYTSRAGLHCKNCARPIQPYTAADIYNSLQSESQGEVLLLCFEYPADENAKQHLTALGYSRVWIDGQVKLIEDLHQKMHTFTVVADRLVYQQSDRFRIIDSLEQALHMGQGKVEIYTSSNHRHVYSNRLVCPNCHIEYRPAPPGLFSFNNPVGACPDCRGFGRNIDIDLDLVIPNATLSIENGAIKPFGAKRDGRMEYRDLEKFCRRTNISLTKPFSQLGSNQKNQIINGTQDYYGIRGFFGWLETKTYKMHVRVYLSRYRGYTTCPTCKGTRFNQQAMLYKISGLDIGQFYRLDVASALHFVESVRIEKNDQAGKLLLQQVSARLRYLNQIGVGYLTLDRQSRTLSSGELQRVALTSALGSNLVNTCYVLDEPSVGLHPRDNHTLIEIMKDLRDRGNTLVVVEHDPDIISGADHLIDLGPGAGQDGGRIVFQGSVSDRNPAHASETIQYLIGKKHIPVPSTRKTPHPDRWLVIEGASENNLKNIDVRIPFDLFVCLTGVSGSGKSTLAEEILYKALARSKGRPQGLPGRHKKLSGGQFVQEVSLVDQQPIGQTPRANPATYIKASDPIRAVFAKTAQARAMGLKAGSFSPNVEGGRCETCRGDGFEKVEMQFLSDVYIACPECHAKRFKPEILQVCYREKNIHDIYEMTVREADEFFSDHPKIVKSLKPLVQIGLGYLKLGQPINTLSGGEAQRLKLAKHLLENPQKGPVLFIFDEPTTGLHTKDIQVLLLIFRRLIEEGHSLLVIEHNLDVIKCADWIIDLGPEGGDLGGRIVAEGTPEAVSQAPGSITAGYLKAALQSAGQANLESKSDFIPVQSKHKNPTINIRGAREHNLKNINVEIPRNQLVAITGVSGSGKSTLAFDILYAEGQRRFLESLTPYVRQYIKVLERADLDHVSGLPPTVAIEQRISHASRRSTVATLTEIYHFLRLLYARLADKNCLICGRKIAVFTQDELIANIRLEITRNKGWLLAPKIQSRKGFHKELLRKAYMEGYRKARIDGAYIDLQPDMALSRYHEHDIALVCARLPCEDHDNLVEKSLTQGNGSLIIVDQHGSEKSYTLKGICPSCKESASDAHPKMFSFNSPQGACPVCQGLGVIPSQPTEGYTVCKTCHGSRLNPLALSYTIQNMSIWDLVKLPADQLASTLGTIKFNERQHVIAEPILSEIHTRLNMIQRLGLSYLTLHRSGDTLSGGEAQRVRLAAQLGSNLTGVCYILDEPTIGLHPKDHRMLLEALEDLCRKGNSVLVVEHDEQTIREADYIIDLGPRAGQAGGRIVAAGTLSEVMENPASLTGKNLKIQSRRITSRCRSSLPNEHITLFNANRNNLKNIDVRFPLKNFICVTGVSGSGKSSLIKQTLVPALCKTPSRQVDPNKPGIKIEGAIQIDRVMEVDHTPIGRTPRSIPASYVGFWDRIRSLFAQTPQAKTRGFSASRFSFNVDAGRCPICMGFGSTRVEMSFLSDVYIRCETCGGRRYNLETLEVKYKGKNIFEILDMTFDEATEFFAPTTTIYNAVKLVCEIGLGYLRLGQSSPTLSGGEAQRIKLASELAKPPAGHTLYVLDEPTTGLHPTDISRLLQVLQALVDRGNTLVVIEHHLDVMLEADYIIDLGPMGGEQGGRVVACGSPREFINHCGQSHTARCLKASISGP